MFVLDTNALVWLMTGDKRLSRTVKTRLEARGQRQQCTSVLCIYEIGVTVTQKRLRLTRDFSEIRRDLMMAGLVEHPVTSAIVMDALGFQNLSQDPIDRMVVATARVFGATLITSDQNILNWPGDLDRLDARA